MSDHQHYTGCHLHHFPCALAEMRKLEGCLHASEAREGRLREAVEAVEVQLAGRLERITALESENRELLIQNAKLHHGHIQPNWMERLHSPAFVEDGVVTTHQVTLKLHSNGPLHSHANDEPPCR